MRIMGGIYNVSIKDGSSIVMAVAAVAFLLLLGCNLPQISLSQCVELSGTCATWLRELVKSPMSFQMEIVRRISKNSIVPASSITTVLSQLDSARQCMRAWVSTVAVKVTQWHTS